MDGVSEDGVSVDGECVTVTNGVPYGSDPTCRVAYRVPQFIRGVS